LLCLDELIFWYKGLGDVSLIDSRSNEVIKELKGIINPNSVYKKGIVLEGGKFITLTADQEKDGSWLNEYNIQTETLLPSAHYGSFFGKLVILFQMMIMIIFARISLILLMKRLCIR